MSKKRSNRAVPDNINEEYYQISSEILSSFPRYRPPVDLFVFREDIAVLTPFSRKGARLTNEQVEEAARLCEEGCLFVSRSDHPIYSQHIVKQLDLVLQDNNLKEAEIAQICMAALQMRYQEFYEQPVKTAFEALQRDAMVVTEFISSDIDRAGLFMRRLLKEYNQVNHAINTMIIGLWLWLKAKPDLPRKDLDNAALGLLTHDVGMSKMPQFLLTRQGPLKSDEKEKILHHAMQSAKIMQKMEQVDPAILQSCFQHHERLDGSGYPQHLKGEQIGLAARIAAIADSFAAMTTDRPYAKAQEPLATANALSMEPGYDGSIARQLVGAYATSRF